VASSASVVGGTLSALLVTGVYGLAFWRIVKANRGNKVIECGVLALLVLLSFGPISKIPNLPDWVLTAIGMLMFLLCLLTMFFLFLQGVHAFLSRKSKAGSSSQPVGTQD
jgi:hypothetical protein